LERFSSGCRSAFEPKGLVGRLVYRARGDGAAATAQILEQSAIPPGVARALWWGPAARSRRPIEGQTFTIWQDALALQSRCWGNELDQPRVP